MRNEAVIGVSCCFLGFYNLLSFYQKNRLYLYNSMIYLAILVFGLMAFIRLFFVRKIKSKQILAQNQHIQEPLKSLVPILRQTTGVALECLDDLPLQLLFPVAPSSIFSTKYLQANSTCLSNKLKTEPSNYSQKLLEELRNADLKSLCEFLKGGNLNKTLRINKVFKVKNSFLTAKFNDYQDKLSVLVPVMGNAGVANTNYLFHCTKKTCSNEDTTCEDLDCSFCQILTKGFLLSCAGKGASTDLRYGKGFYFSPDLNKSMQYAQSESLSVIITKVVMGRVYTPKDEGK